MKSPCRTVALETSTPAGSVALMEDDSLLELRSTGEGQDRTRGLAQLVGQLISSHELTPRDIDLLAVGLGPGSYTGLRAAAAFAHGFSLGTGCALQGVSSFAALASKVLAGEPEGETVLVSDATGGAADEQYAAAFRKEKNSLEEIVSLQVFSWKELLELYERGWLAAGKGAHRLKEAVGAEVRTREEKEPSAHSVALLGRTLHLSRENGSPDDLEPLYVRKSRAEINWSRRRREG